MIGEELRAEIEKPARRRGMGPIQPALGLLLSVLLIWWVFGDFKTTPALVAPDAPAPRVASTSPAITDSLVALGVGAHVVGRSPYCRSVPGSVPVVGDLRDFDAERLAIVRPEVLFVQPPLAGVDPALREWCGRNGVRLVEQRIDSLAELSALGDSIEGVFGSAVAGSLASMRAALAPAAPVPEQAPRVLVVVSADPFLAVGTGNYLDELLARCGVRNAVAASGWVELSAEAIVAVAPDRAIGLAETEAGALDIAGFLEVLPWQGAPPEIRAERMPEMLSPSFAALARRDALERLVAGPRERAP
ncbi:MAG: hypothetical protein RL325_519 [Planctomycetota bacterium]